MPPIIQMQPPSFLPRQRLYLPFSGLNPPHALASPPAPGDPRAHPALRSELPDVRTCPAQRLAFWDELSDFEPGPPSCPSPSPTPPASQQLGLLCLRGLVLDLAKHVPFVILEVAKRTAVCSGVPLTKARVVSRAHTSPEPGAPRQTERLLPGP